MTHLKVVAVALVCATLVAGIGLAARVTELGTADTMTQAGKPVHELGLRYQRARSGTGTGQGRWRFSALLVPDQDSVHHYRAIELILCALQRHVAHEHPGEGAAQDETHGHDAGRGGQEPESECQLFSASSSR